MKRLTYEVHDGGIFVKESDVKTYEVEDEVMHTGNAIRKLAEYEDLDDKGLLLRLSCKEVYESNGDTVYYIFEDEITECINCGVSIDADGKLYFTLICDENIFPYREPDAEHDNDSTDWCTDSINLSIDEYGKTVFLSKEQAEETLKRMED